MKERKLTLPVGPNSPEFAGSPKTVMIVDDSRVMRAWLRSVLEADPRLSVVDEACDAHEARDKLRARTVDVLTLDIEMPRMSGLEFLTRLMRARPMPVVMMSSLTSEGSDAAVQALSLGAIDCMVKPSRAFGPELMRDICERVFHAACTRPSQLATRRATPTAPAQFATQTKLNVSSRERCDSLVLIGASTGGVAALETVLPDLRPDGPPVVVVQHMPGNFLKSFVSRLDRMLHQNVCLAQQGMQVRRGDIVLAPGEGQHTEVRRRNGTWECHFIPNDPPRLHCPAVDVLFQSAVTHARDITGAILTGLGRDGADGLAELCKAGARTFGQNEETCVVYGMPRAAKAEGAVQNELPLEEIANAINASFQRGSRGQASSSVATS